MYEIRDLMSIILDMIYLMHRAYFSFSYPREASHSTVDMLTTGTNNQHSASGIPCNR